MKRIYFLLVPLAVLIFSCSTNTGSRSVADGSKLYRITAEGKLSHEFEYNLNGTIAKQSIYGIQEKKMMEQVYFYDSTDRLVKTESYSDVSSSTLTQLLVYNYTDYKYDAGGRLLEEIFYTKKGSLYELTSKSVQTYDAMERVISRLQLSIDNKPFNLTTYEYDAEGNVIVQETFQYDGTTPKPASRSVYEHDTKRNPYVKLSVMPFSVNRNNIVKHTFTNYNSISGTPTVNTSQTLYKSYNSAGYPIEVLENGTTFIFEYR